VIEHEHLDTTLSEIIDHVIAKLNEAIQSGVDVSERDRQTLERAIDVKDKTVEGSITRETVS
jgi:hypothetical protein